MADMTEDFQELCNIIVEIIEYNVEIYYKYVEPMLKPFRDFINIIKGTIIQDRVNQLCSQ